MNQNKEELKKKIEKLRDQLNEMLANGKTPPECLEISRELDDLVNEYMGI